MIAICFVVVVALAVLGTTHTISWIFTAPGESIRVDKAIDVQSDILVGDPVTGLTLAAGTNTQVALAVDVSQMSDLFIYSTTACTIKTNSTGSPADTVSVSAGIPTVWTSAGGGTNPIGSADVTTIYVTNVADTVLYIRIGYGDATP